MRAGHTTVAALTALALAACGSGSQHGSGSRPSRSSREGTGLPGTGKPIVAVGDKNFTEQFVLGELYFEALQAQGFSVVLNRNIGPTEVTLQALRSGQLGIYPEYLGLWNLQIAGQRRKFSSAAAAYRAGQRYALAHGFKLLHATPFSDTTALGVTFNYATHNELGAIGDLRKVARTLTLGGPPQFQQDPKGLPELERQYGFVPATFKSLEIGTQYQALDQGTVQAADVGTTDGELVSGNYTLLKDSRHVFGWGNVLPVVPQRVLAVEGPAFAATVNKVSALLTTGVMRQLNAAVDLSHEDPAIVAKQFLLAHGLVAPNQPTTG